MRFFRRKVHELIDWLQGNVTLVYCEHGAHRSAFIIMTLLALAGCRSKQDKLK